MKKSVTVFYSWQSDLPSATNRNFLQDVLKQSLKQVGYLDVPERPTLDRDTQDTPGSPDITLVIFEKITEARAFVADVSLIQPPDPPSPNPPDPVGGSLSPSKGDRRRNTPNPNVLIELGYAAAVLGWERVLLVFNTASGKVEDLPFDLRHKRILPYHLPPGTSVEEKKLVKEELKKVFIKAIEGILKVQPPSVADVVFGDESRSVIFENSKRHVEKVPRHPRDLDLASRTYRLQLQFRNLGKKSLKDVNGTLEVPAGCSVYTREDMEYQLKGNRIEDWAERTAFLMVRSKIPDLGAVFDLAHFDLMVLDSPNLEPPHSAKELTLKSSHRKMEFQVKHAYPKRKLPLQPFYLVVDKEVLPQEVTVKVQVFAEHFQTEHVLHLSLLP